MSNNKIYLSNKALNFGLVTLVMGLSIIFGFVISFGKPSWLSGLFLIPFIGVITVLVFQQPYLGLAFIIASLPVIDILPSIPFATSVVSLLGGVTLGIYILRALRPDRHFPITFPPQLIWGGLFIAWMFFTNPSAALIPTSGRNWMFTFVQLWILAFLSSQLMDEPRKHKVLMWIYSIAALVSAGFAIQSGSIGETVAESIRSSGLAGGQNEAGRYFVVALVFISYLRSTTKSKIVSTVLLICMGLTVLGVFMTVSRTALLLLLTAVGLLIILQANKRNNLQLTIAIILILIIVFVFADNILSIMRTILPSIQQGEDTMGIRYNLWTAGWHMWLDHPLQGVGIGQFPINLPYYGQGLLSSQYLKLGAHNMYVQLLAETGMVGLFLFLGLVGSVIRNLWKATRSQDSNLASLAKIWLIVLILMLLGGITKQDQFDKLVWISFGMGVSQLFKSGKPLLKSPLKTIKLFSLKNGNY